MNIVFMGQQGAGKGTVAALVKEKLAVPHISTGDIFREAIKEGTELGKKAQDYINKGELVPDEVTVKMIAERLAKDDCKKGFILDGFPRNLDQAKKLNDMVKIDKAILLDITDDLTVYRLTTRRVCKECGATFNLRPDLFPHPTDDGKCTKCGGEIYQRDDDKEEAIRERLKIYHTETEPIKGFYEKQGVLRVVDGSQKAQENAETVMKAIES